MVKKQAILDIMIPLRIYSYSESSLVKKERKKTI